ncbi:HAMP domain-containing histidine kinase [Apilactobacillus apisilvae]|uniref:Signal transduction histidine-protein kinase ArlS n=1 Tax=Apilactobacillus apisilvae TaxID=2923364 RepID=A0ABY4PI10_9LACO|nr:HAMP domain-containing histidine kinase [Apilactobacillus apisilvae]UQS85285.1 HAMP domain-containing histidine kinase [Apilactobacillus apisilvae]
MILKNDDDINHHEHNKKYLSLKWKWSIGSAIIIFLILSIFSFLIYDRFSDVLLSQETAHTSETLDSISGRLTKFNDTLSEKEVISILIPQNEKIKNHKELGKVSSNSIFSSISKDDIVVNVFDKDANSIFFSKETPKQLINIKHINNRVKERVNYSNHSSLIEETPIYSKVDGKKIGYLRIINNLNDYRVYTRKLFIILIVILLLGIFFASLLSYILAAYMLRPIKIISNTINSVNDSPKTEVRVPDLHQNDELSDLGNLFNDMLDTMQRYIDQQQQFVGDVSHELRTPVAVIQGHLDMLSRWGKDDPEILNESIKSSVDEINRMKSLVQEMLDLSRAEQVEINYNNKLTDVQDIVHQEYNDFKMIHPDYTFNLDDDIDDETIIQIYRNHLEQILIILLDNAVKYSTKRKEIHISLSIKYRYVDIAVQDFGEGINEESINKIFNRFYRVDKARSRDQGGNGLGLSIAKRLVEAYHGKISVESSAGYGSIFTISFPILTQDKIEHIKNIDNKE